MKLNKSFTTNSIATLFIGISYITDQYSSIFLFTGLFALSGALTNLLAIHMLFEKVPFLYGSGVIPARFEAFKEAIKNLMMDEFFTAKQLSNFFENEEKKINVSTK